MNTVLVGFGFMGMTHTLNILKNPRIHLKAIVDKVPGNIFTKLTEQSGNFATGNVDAKDLSGVNIYSDFGNIIWFMCICTCTLYQFTHSASVLCSLSRY